VWRVESFKLLLGQIGEVQVAGRHKVAGKDADFTPALARPPALVPGYLVVLAQHLYFVPLGQAQLILAYAFNNTGEEESDDMGNN
jgi:hypothetical protein